MLTDQQKRLIDDNPNLSNTVLSRFLNVARGKILRYKSSIGLDSQWKHKGVGVPFTRRFNTKDGEFTIVSHKRNTIFTGTTRNATINADRLIYCLENNNGKLPPTFDGWVMKNLEFIKR